MPSPCPPVVKLVCAAAVTAVASAVPTPRPMSWCAGPANMTQSPQEFRGQYRDVSLWLASPGHPGCEELVEHRSGNDGLWVIEYDEEPLLLSERARMLSLPSVQLLARRNNSLVVAGGEAAADALGYDACGAEKDKRFISVPTGVVRAPAAMTPERKAFYRSRIKQPRQMNLDLLDLISESQLVDTISHLQAYQSRNSFSGPNGLDEAVEWAEAQFLGYGFETTRIPFREDMTPQVVATLRGTVAPDSVVVVGAHYDSRGTQNSSPTQRAPGADDNGSGSASVLELARVIHETGATFRHTLKLCLFTGEEQGLVGSRALASQYAEEGVDVVAMFNADMIGYAPEGDDIVLAYMNRFSDPDLTELSRDITELYVPEVQTDLTNVCCSDQQSFYENGFSSVGFFETPNPSVVYPQYHTSDDLLQFLSSEKIYLLSKATLASAIVFAEPLDMRTPPRNATTH